ncbi:MAG: methylenetetrahydrofolate reductase [Candidatus Thermoplasmatota archaeon]|nr:methylenetetrahydrofolate reductase [Candidatus Thermoplasmatota archaeon]
MKAESHLEKLLEKGEFAVTGECGPPQSADPGVIRKKIDLLRGSVDAANITDNQTAIARLCSMAAGVIMLGEGLEPIMQMTCRDRNRLAIQSDILGAASLGIKNLLCLTGDHQTFGNHPGSKNVFDLDSIQLIQLVKVMRDEKKFQCGDDMDVEPRIFIGAAANPFGDPFEFRVARLAKKIAAGVDFIQTQGIYDIERFEKWMDGVCERGLDKKAHILGGVIPFKSLGAAKYIKFRVPGMSVPDEITERMKNASDAKKEGVQIAIETVEALKEMKGVHGVHIMAIEWEEKVPEIAEGAGLLPRPGVA